MEQLSKQRDLIKNQEYEITQRKNVTQQREKELKQREKELKQKDKEIQKKDKEIQKQDTQIQLLRKELEKSKLKSEKESEKLKLAATNLEQQIIKEQNEIAHVRQSLQERTSELTKEKERGKRDIQTLQQSFLSQNYQTLSISELQKLDVTVTGDRNRQSNNKIGAVGVVSQRDLKTGTILVDDTSIWIKGTPDKKETAFIYKDGYFDTRSTLTSLINKRSNGNKDEKNIEIIIQMINEKPAIVWRVTKQIEQNTELLIESKQVINKAGEIPSTNQTLQWNLHKMLLPYCTLGSMKYTSPM